MIVRALALAIVLVQLFCANLSARSPVPQFKADYVIAHKWGTVGRIIAIEGVVRFDRLSQRGFLYKSAADMRKRNYRQTIFLELGNENYASMKISDGSKVLVTGYVSRELHGPLGVYAAHMIVDQMHVISSTR